MKSYQKPFVMSSVLVSILLIIGLFPSLIQASDIGSPVTNTYTVKVNRAAPIENPIVLESLTLSAGILVPGFDPSVTSYTLNVPNAVYNTTLIPFSTLVNSIITVNGASADSGSIFGPISLMEGINDISVRISQGTIFKDYLISITRQQPITTNQDRVFSASPNVQVDVNPNYFNRAGIFIGIKDIKDALGVTAVNKRIAGYQLEVDYDPTKLTVLDVVYEANLGSLTMKIDPTIGKVMIADVNAFGVNEYDKLLFIPVYLKGSTKDITNVTIKFQAVLDNDLNSIEIPNPYLLTFQRGKVLNSADTVGAHFT